MKPLFLIVVTCLILAIKAHPENIEDVKNLPQDNEPVSEAEESAPQARVERCTTCTKSKFKSPKDVLAAIQQLPGEVHTQQTFEGCSSEKGCAGLKLKDGRVVEKFGNVDALKNAALQDKTNEFTFQPAGGNALNGANGPFWWMNQNSPFKNSEAFEKFSQSSSFTSNGASANGADIGGNIFLNGGLATGADKPNYRSSSSSFESSSFSSSNSGNVGLDLAQNPFLNNGAGQFGASANNFKYVGSTPGPFTASTAGANVNLIQNSQKANGFEYEGQSIDEAFQNTGNVFAQENSGGAIQQTCAGQGYVCVPRAQCNNGVVNTNGAPLLQANTLKQYCNVGTEICCRIETAGASGPGAQGTSLFGSTQADASQGNFGFASSNRANGFGAQNSFGSSSNSFGSEASANRRTSQDSSSFDSRATVNNFGESGYGATIGSTLLPPTAGNTGGSGFNNEVYKSTSQSNFAETDTFSAGSEVSDVYRPGAVGSGLKPGIPYLPPVDSSNVVTSTAFPTTFVTTPRPFTTPRPIVPRPSPTVKPYLPPVPSTPAQPYLPPETVGQPTNNKETISPPDYNNGGIILDETRPPPPSNIPAGCAAALKCTPIEFCTAEGVISTTSVILTRDQESYRVPLTDCRDLETGRAGKCCRDPFYTDPWPTNQLGRWVPGVFGGNDGKYVPDSRGSPTNNVRPQVTARPPTAPSTGSTLLNNFITPKPVTRQPLGPNQLTPGYPSPTPAPTFVQKTQFGQGSYGQKGVGQVGVIGVGQTSQGAQGSYGQGSQFTQTSSSRGQTQFQGVGQTATQGFGQTSTQGASQTSSQGIGQGVRFGQGAIGQQGSFAQGSRKQFEQGVAQSGQAVTSGQGSGVISGSGLGVSQGAGISAISGQGQTTFTGQGTRVTGGQGQILDQGVGSSVQQGQGVRFSQSSGSRGVQSVGQSVSQDTAQGVRQGAGFGIRQGSGVGTISGNGQSVSQGQGFDISQGQGVGVSQGFGQGVKQGFGQSSSQSQSTVVSQGFGQGVNRGQGVGESQGFGQGINQGFGQGVSQGFGQSVSQGQGTVASQGFGQGVRQSTGQRVNQGQGVEVTQSFGQSESQTKGFGINQGSGQGVNRGQGVGVSQGFGQGISQGFGQGISQGFGQGVSQGFGQGVRQGVGFGSSQGQGFGISQGAGEAVNQGFGTGFNQGGGISGQRLVSGRGQALIQGEGETVVQGIGTGVRQGEGFTVTQGGGVGVENEYSASTQRVFLKRYSGGGQCGLLNPQKPFGNRNDLEVDFAEIPWQAMVLLQTNRSLLCGGVITRPEVVVTSAACVDGLDAKNVLIKGGEWKLGIDDEPLPFQIVQVKTILRHPEYKRGSLKNDVAILVLAENLRFAKNIQPICLPSKEDTLDAFYNGAGECIVTGWGKIVLQAHLSGSIMHALNVSLINPGECEAKLSQDYPHLLEDYSEDSCVCGQPTNPLNNICKVDIGSALACTTGDNQYVMRGVYSWDSGCQIGNQIAGFYKFDIEWYEWAIGLIESVRFAKYTVGTKVTQSKITQVSSVKTSKFSSGVNGAQIKGGSSTGSFSQGFGVEGNKGASEAKGQAFGFSQFGSGKYSEVKSNEGNVNFGTELKGPLSNTFSATYTEKKVFQSEPKYVTYTTKPEIVTFTTKPEYFTFTTKPKIVRYTTKPEIVTYTTKPEIVTFTTKPEYFTYTTKPKVVTYTTKPQIITYETSGSGTNPQYVAPGITFNPSFTDVVNHKHNSNCKCLEGK